MCSLSTIARIGAGAMTFGGSEAAKAGLDSLNQEAPLTNQNGDQLSDADQAALSGVVNPEQKATMLMNWLVGPKPKTVNPGEEFARSERMAGVVAKADAGKGMGGLFGMGLLVGDTAPNLNLPVGQPGQEPSAIPIADLTPEAPAPVTAGNPTPDPGSERGGYTGGPVNGPGGGTTQTPTSGTTTALRLIGGKK